MHDVSLDGKVAVVTGAGRGLGRAEALALAEQGARVVVNDHGLSLDGREEGADPAETVVEEIRAGGGEAVAHDGDVADFAAAEELVKTALSTFGDLDIVVNNAGILRDKMIFSMSEEDFDAVVRVHLKGHFCTLRHATAYWRRRSKEADGPVDARVINTTSEAFLLGSPGQPNYAAAKGGIVGLTLSVAHGCSRYGVKANVIAPRARTRMTAEVFGESDGAEDDLAPDRVAPLVAFLASPATASLTGQLFVVYSDIVARMGAPQVETLLRAPGGGPWTVEQLAEVAGPALQGGDGSFAATDLLKIGDADV